MTNKESRIVPLLLEWLVFLIVWAGITSFCHLLVADLHIVAMLLVTYILSGLIATSALGIIFTAMAKYYFRRQRFQKAIRYFQEAAQHMRPSPKHLCWMAACQQLLDNHVAARRYLNWAEIGAPSDCLPPFMSSISELRLGNLAAAGNDVNKAIRLSKDDNEINRRYKASSRRLGWELGHTEMLLALSPSILECKNSASFDLQDIESVYSLLDGRKPFTIKRTEQVSKNELGESKLHSIEDKRQEKPESNGAKLITDSLNLTEEISPLQGSGNWVSDMTNIDLDPSDENEGMARQEMKKFAAKETKDNENVTTAFVAAGDTEGEAGPEVTNLSVGGTGDATETIRIIPVNPIDKIPGPIEEQALSEPADSESTNDVSGNSSAEEISPVGIERPNVTKTNVTRHERNSEVVDWILNNANGRCECCEKEAPFLRSDGSLYLEVHHLRRLADGGSDTISNAIAVCPNCHTELHRGLYKEQLISKIYAKIQRLRKE